MLKCIAETLPAFLLNEAILYGYSFSNSRIKVLLVQSFLMSSRWRSRKRREDAVKNTILYKGCYVVDTSILAFIDLHGRLQTSARLIHNNGKHSNIKT